MGLFRMKKIAVIASSRATWGYEKKVAELIEASPNLKLQLIVTGSHLLKEYGYTIDEIRKSGLPIASEVEMMVGGDSPSAWVKSIGVEIQSLAQVYSSLKPDLLLISGDRAEMFAAAVAAAYMNIPVAHVQAGDVSGHIDGSIRHAITKIAHIHFPSCEDSAQRVKRLGEEEWRIFNVGAPQLDEIVHGKIITKSQLEKDLKIDLSLPTILVIQHAVLVEKDQAYDQMKETMLALNELNYQTLLVYPNIDSGGSEIIRAMDDFKSNKNFHYYRNLDRDVYINLLRNIHVLLGNSSSGILEAPSFKLPAVNVGDRQRGRMRAKNVIDVECSKTEIIKGVKKALHDPQYRQELSKVENPYGDGNSSEKIVKILTDLKLSTDVLDKKITY